MLSGLAGGATTAGAATHEKPAYASAMKAVTIKGVKAIGTAPAGSNLVVVKVE
ncbi:MAG TPA: hypothetical protein VKI61_09310 [Chitinophagaceae bacterium]|jgi:mannonate dehydratase|nr:hypothetical protein [Chitinophagaceae bacterium]